MVLHVSTYRNDLRGTISITLLKKQLRSGVRLPDPVLDGRDDVHVALRKGVVSLHRDRKLVVHRVVGHRRGGSKGRRAIVAPNHGRGQVATDFQDVQAAGRR